MATYDVVEKKSLCLTEVKEIINNKEKDNELGYRENKVKDYLKKIKTINFSELNKLKEELISLNIKRLDETDIIKIINIMPKNGTELRCIISNTGTIIVDEEAKKIIDVLDKYRT